MLIKNNGTNPITMNLRDGSSYVLQPGVPTSVPDAATTMIDDSPVLIALFNAGTLTVTTDAGGAFSGFPTVVNASDSAAGKLLTVRAKVSAGGARSLVDETGQAVGGPGYVTTARKLIQSYEAAVTNNPRINPVMPSYELLSLTYYADAAALQTAFPAAANANKAGYVGTSASYQIFVSDGAAWTARTGIFAYFRASEAPLSNWVETRLATEYGFTSADDFGGKAVAGKVTMLGGIGGSPSAGTSDPQMSSYTKNKAGAFEGRPGRYRIKATEKQMLASFQGYSGSIQARIGIGGVWRYLSDPTLLLTATSGLPRYFGLKTVPNGGFLRVLMDFSAVGSDYWEIEFECSQPAQVKGVFIRPKYSYQESQLGYLRGLVVTDSLGSTSPDAGAENAWPQWMRDFIGQPDTYIFSDGSTGFVANAGGAARTHLEKLQHLGSYPQFAPRDWLMLVASVNDGANFSGIQSAIRGCVAYANTKWSNPLTMIVGPTAAALTQSQADMLAVDQMLAAFVPSLGLQNVIHVPTMSNRTGQPIVGTSTIDSPTGAGSSELFFLNADTTHFAMTGHRIWGRDVVPPNAVQALRNLVG